MIGGYDMEINELLAEYLNYKKNLDDLRRVL